MPAPYCLAIDIGTSRTAAAIARTTPGGVVATSVPLGRASDNAPTAVFVSDGELLFGDAAERRGASAPGRLIREFKRRIGDDVPILAGDRAFAPEELYALTVDWAARIVIEREGRSPERLALTVPASWGDYRSDLVRSALAAEGWRDVDIVTEPEAAARHYESTNPLSAGLALAVYDFGGGTFDAVVLRKDRDGDVRIVGSPQGIADLGGADFDDAVVRHIVSAARVDATALAGETAGRMALAALRRECVEAKESLSFDSEAVIPVILSGDQRTVRLTRDEFELMIAADLERTADALDDALATAGIGREELDAILLTGGSSRIPRVAQVVSERFDRPIAIDTDPKAVIALGAARASWADVLTASAADAETAALVEDDQDKSPAAQEQEASSSDRRRPWYRRLPATAYLAGAFAIALTGAGIAAAPALGSGAPGTQLAAGESVSFAEAAPSLSLFSPPAFDAAPEVKTFVPEAEVPEAQRQGSDSPRTPSKQVARASTQGPAGGQTPKDAKASGGPNSSAPKAGGGSSPAPADRSTPKANTPAPTPDQNSAGPVTPSPMPSTPDPDPVTPTPEPSASDPGTPTPEPSESSTPTPEPSTPDPAPADPEPAPSDAPAPEPAASAI